MSDRTTETEINKDPKKIVEKAFALTQKEAQELGWTGTILQQEGALSDYISPKTGSVMNEYVGSYPSNLLRFISAGKVNLSPESIALINIAYIWSLAQKYKNNPNAFSGNLSEELANDPRFRLAQLLIEPQESGIVWQDIISSQGFSLDIKLNNGEEDRKFNPELIHLKAEKVRGIIPTISENRSTLSAHEVLNLIERQK